MTIMETIKARLVEIESEMNQLQADANERLLTAEEKTKLVGLTTEYSDLKADLDLRNQVVAVKATNAQPQRKTSPEAVRPALSITAGSPWKTIGHYAMDVRAARSNPDIRQKLVNAASTYSSEGVDADGGYAVPDDLKREIQQKVLSGPDDFLSRCDIQRSFSNTMTFPRDTEEDWAATATGSAQIVNEGADYTQGKVGLGTIQVNSAKVGFVLNATEELVNDALAFTTYLQSKGARRMKYAVNSYLIAGATGSNTPWGVLNHASLKTVATGSENATVKLSANNVQKMFFSCPQAYRNDGIWIVSDSVEETLPNLTLSGSSLYLRPGDFRGAPDTGLLLGRPVVVSPQAKALGTKGDIMFVAFSQYLAFVKSDIQSNFNPYLYWLSDTLSWKFSVRMGGRPWIDAPVTTADGSTRSPFVALAPR